jgi:hypothetical protein
MRKLLEFLYVIQKRTLVRKHNGRVIHTLIQNRLNPYNPLTYIAILIYYIVAIIMFGFVGFIEKLLDFNFFTWQSLPSMASKKKTKMQEALNWCNENDKSTEFTIEFIASEANCTYEEAFDFLISKSE